MSQIDPSKLINYCTEISRNVRRTFPHLDLHFLIYQSGEKIDKIARLMPHLASHPAHDAAASLLKFKTIDKDNSGFLGLVDGYETVHLRLKDKQKKSLAFIALNISQYSKFDDATNAAHFFTAQLMDALANNSSQNQSFQKKNQFDICQLNLKSDIYSVLHMANEGLYDAARNLAVKRAIETMMAQTTIKPEDNPFPLTLDVLNYTFEHHLLSSIISKSPSPMVGMFQLAHQISSCFEIENIESWIHFANCSQTMAWSGFSASQILGAAINTSTDPFIKAIGHLLSELTNLSPIAAEHIPAGYNPFVPDEINLINHERLIDDTFEMSLIHMIEADSALPLLRVANNQNEALIKGKISGWCASALQAAAKAYNLTKDNQDMAIKSARLAFESSRIQSNWNQLVSSKQHVINQFKQAEDVNFPSFIRWCQETPASQFIIDSVLLTLEDPKYTKQEGIADLLSKMKTSELLSM